MKTKPSPGTKVYHRRLHLKGVVVPDVGLGSQDVSVYVQFTEHPEGSNAVKEVSWNQLDALLPYKKGDRVRIKKGAIVHSTSSEIPREGKFAARDRVVTLHNVDHGYDSDDHHSREPNVEWVGSGGYWFWTHDLDCVERA